MSGDQGFKNDGDLTGDAFAGDQGKEKKMLETRWNRLCVCCFVTDKPAVTRGSAVTRGFSNDGGLIVDAFARVSMEQVMRLLRLHGELAVTRGSRVTRG